MHFVIIGGDGVQLLGGIYTPHPRREQDFTGENGILRSEQDLTGEKGILW